MLNRVTPRKKRFFWSEGGGGGMGKIRISKMSGQFFPVTKSLPVRASCAMPFKTLSPLLKARQSGARSTEYKSAPVPGSIHTIRSENHRLA